MHVAEGHGCFHLGYCRAHAQAPRHDNGALPSLSGPSSLMHCRAMYHNLVANATRLAKTEKDVTSIARVAAGESQAVADASMLKGQKSGDIAAGLQGYVDKPRHAVG